MERLSTTGIAAARILIAAVFLLNGLGIIDQTIPAKELAEHGMPAALVPLVMVCGRLLELVAGLGLALGVFPRLSALALLAFIVPATFVSHAFWTAIGTPDLQRQLINFGKNMAIWGGLLFIASTPAQPSLIRSAKVKDDREQRPAVLRAWPANE